MKSRLVRNGNGTILFLAVSALLAATPGAVGQECVVSSAPEPEMIKVPSLFGNLQLLTTNRFLVFTAGDPDRNQAVRVSFEDLRAPFDIWNGSQLWVAATSEVSENGATVEPIPDFATFHAATLRCEPFFTNWFELGTVNVFHEGIVPDSEYRIEVIDETCDPESETGFSPALSLATTRWGEVVPKVGGSSDVVSIIDVVSILQRFVSDPISPRKARTDLEPACVDLVISISDVLSALKGFQGLSYPFEPNAADPCDSTCENPLP